MPTIKIRRSTTAGAAPSSLVTGELAINEADGVLYYRNSSGVVTPLVSAAERVITYSSQTTAQMAGRTVLFAGSTATTIQLDATAVPLGTIIRFIRTGTASLTVEPTEGSSLFAQSTNVLSQPYGALTAVKIGTTTWHAEVSPLNASPVQIQYASLKAYAEYLLTQTASTPTAGGALSINGQAVGNHDYIIKTSATTISSFTNSDWFTNTEDTASAWVVINGNLTINSGITLQPTNRKLFMVVYVNGNLTLNGNISMSLRGANHSATTAVPIRVANGTYSSISNPTIPATGGAGGTSGAGTAGPSLGSGGGGKGAAGGTGSGGNGAAGTCFSGGPGGGSGYNAAGGAGGANGGAGGAGAGGASGGVGNPSGSNVVNGSIENGTGGTLIVIVNGTVSGSGQLAARGGDINSAWSSILPASGLSGGGSGGGIVVLMNKSVSGITNTVAGGTSTGGIVSGGAGGAGTYTALTIP